MQEVVANLDHVKFDLEYAIEQQLGVQPLPFTGMDSKFHWIFAFNVLVPLNLHHIFNFVIVQLILKLLFSKGNKRRLVKYLSNASIFHVQI